MKNSEVRFGSDHVSYIPVRYTPPILSVTSGTGEIRC